MRVFLFEYSFQGDLDGGQGIWQERELLANIAEWGGTYRVSDVAKNSIDVQYAVRLEHQDQGSSHAHVLYGCIGGPVGTGSSYPNSHQPNTTTDESK